MTQPHKPLSYTEKKQVYSGPFCDVYQCEAPTGETVALKVVDLDFLHKPHNFRREIKFLKCLSHPNIARFIDSFAHGEDHFMVMRFYEIDLNGVLDRFSLKRMKYNLHDPTKYDVVSTNGLNTEHIAPMVWSLVLALKYIHEHGLIHRDIKPGNIFFPSVERLDSPVIGDFGISYDTTNPPADEPPAEKYTDVCTGYYKAPELCFGVTDYGTELDLWSLGILISVLYSKTGNPINYVKTEADDPERVPELNDFVLILGVFTAFGTPDVADNTSELYWQKLGESKYHFTNFHYKKMPRKPIEALLPRCRDDEIKALFTNLTRYENRLLSLEVPSSI